MKIIGIGDIHGRNIWKKIISDNEDADEFVFVADYFDSYDVNTTTQVNNFLDIIEFKKTSGKKVVLLKGNHDHHYLEAIGNTGTGGYQAIGSFMITPVIEANKEHLQIAYSFDNLLFTHAGVGESFMDITFGKGGWKMENIAEDLNELDKYKPRSFIFNGRNNSGDDMGQTPIWIRPRSLMRDSQEIKKKYIQIVGHTHGKEIDIKGKSTGGKYFFIDTLPYQYLIWEDGKFSLGIL